MMTRAGVKIALLSFFGAVLFAGCSNPTSDELADGGLEPPPGFLEQVDANCRAETDLALSDDAPTVRALNSQSLLAYSLMDGGTVQCAVRHADGSVIDVRVIGDVVDRLGPEPAWQEWVDRCKPWDSWDKPGPPFRIYANSYYVGTCGIAAILVTGPDGHVLIDAGTKIGAGHVADNIESLGFDVSDVEYLLSSHEHHDHVGGLAELQRRSDAQVVASAAAASVLQSGEAAETDPQFGMNPGFDPVTVARIVADGDIVTLGPLAFTAMATPGHTEGALSWQWESCKGATCETLVYADSLSPISRDDYRFSDHPELVSAFRAGLDRLSEVECDLLMTPHPSASGLRPRLKAKDLTEEAPCIRYADNIRNRLDRRLAKEQAED